jgi:hypothetical protein
MSALACSQKSRTTGWIDGHLPFLGDPFGRSVSRQPLTTQQNQYALQIISTDE